MECEQVVFIDSHLGKEIINLAQKKYKLNLLLITRWGLDFFRAELNDKFPFIVAFH